MTDYPTPSFRQTDRNERVRNIFPELERIFAAHAESRHVPGIAYGVILDGELIFAQSLGVSNITSQESVTADTVFRIASMTKSFAALAILQLRDAGQLLLDEPAATYVPALADIPYPTADSAPVTVRQLLSMDSGWPQDDPWADRQLYRTDAAVSDFYRNGVSWSNPPGSQFEYSNYSYMVLGRIITNVSSRPAIDYMTQNILLPLGMKDTYWHPADVPEERLAQGYRWEDEQWKPEELLPTGGDVVAFAGILTTIRDLTRWVNLFLSAWPARDEDNIEAKTAATVLSRSSLREMQRIWTAGTPRAWQSALGCAPSLSAGGYGFGLSLDHNGRWMRVGHGGGLPGFGSYMCWLPHYNVGLVALSNVTYGGVGLACIDGLELIVEKGKIEPRTVPVSSALATAQERLIDLMHEWDDDLADELLADNFLLDLDKDHWLARFNELAEMHGALSVNGVITPQNWLRGEWRMSGERGWCDIFISLSPTVPPRIQTLKIDSTLPPSANLEAAMTAVAKLISNPNTANSASIFEQSLSEDERFWNDLWDQVQIAHILCGECSVGQIAGGDGQEWVCFELVGSKRTLETRIELNGLGKVRKLSFMP